MADDNREDILFGLWEQLDALPLEESYVVLDDEKDNYDAPFDPFEGFSPRELRAIFWLALEMKIQNKFEELITLLRRIREGEPVYQKIYLSKRDGGRREINVPSRALKTVQRKLNRRLLAELSVNKNAFGFSRGGIINAIEPHLNSRVLLCVDFQNAFPTVRRENLMDALIGGRVVWQCGPWWKKSSYSVKPGIFSWYAANAIADLTALEDKLPQGAPTSPRLFDLVCYDLDKRLSALANRVGGIYTRYADNIFFSLVSKENFDKALSRTIMHIIEGRRGVMPKFNWHKFRIVKLSGEAHRMLGLNVMGGQIHNTRSFKRKLRLMIHHVSCLLEKEMDWEEAWEQLHGMMQFAQIKTLPPKLVEEYKKLEEEIN